MTTYEALNRYDKVVRTFNTADLAEAYRDRMAALGSTVTLRKRGARTIWREAGRAAA